MNCRHCSAELTLPLIDLGSAPPSNSSLSTDGLLHPEKWYPLRVMVCTRCWLVQTQDFAQREEFFSEDYAYFSSFSSSWLAHSRAYAEGAIERLKLDGRSHVVEIASNDGYLLQYFAERGIPCLGVEPTASTAQAARARGLQVIGEFFGASLARRIAHEQGPADLMVANNVLAHVPDINDFVSGFRELLKPDGVVTFEFPHLYRLVVGCQFDTIYHEHFSYLSLTAVRRLLAANGLHVFDVDELPTHGGSLRVHAQREPGARPTDSRVDKLLALEAQAGMLGPDFYRTLGQAAIRIKRELLEFLLAAQRRGEQVAAYGAAAKGNTLLNYCGIRDDLIAYVVDRNPSKQGKFLPGSRIPIVPESHLLANKPRWVLILPWNLADEVRTQLGCVRDWHGQFVTAVPSLSMS